MKKRVGIFSILFVFTCFSFLTCEKDKGPESITNKLEFSKIEVDSVSYREAKISYELENFDNNNVQSFGICYNKSGEPTQDDSTVSLTISSSGNKKIDGLSPDTQYYFRFYVELGGTMIYSDDENFSTSSLGKPSLTTTEVTNIDTSSATTGGNIINNRGSSITARGVCWSNSENPTIEENEGKTDDGEGTGEFTSDLTGLTENTSYYLRAYATNEVGTAYGQQKEFRTGMRPIADFIADTTKIQPGNSVQFTDESTGSPTSMVWDFGDGATSREPTPSHIYSSEGTYTVELTVSNEYGEDTETKADYITVGNNGTFVDQRDGQEYEWLKIGDQVWMADNLNYDVDSSWCWGNNSSNCDTYGHLYKWNAVMQGESSSNSNPSGVQGVCPDGWHVPSDEEWKELEMQLGMSQTEVGNTGYRGTNEGSKLAGNASLWPSGDLTSDSEFGTSGFTALPGGNHNDGPYYY